MNADRRPVTGKPQKFPKTLLMGDFSLEVEEITHPGKWDASKKQFREVSGTAWLRFECGGSPIRTLDPGARSGIPRLQYAFEVVSRVVNPQTQISYIEAQRIQPEVQIGQTLTLDLAVKPAELLEIVQLGKGVLDWLDISRPKGQILVEFEKVTVRPVKLLNTVGRIVQGVAVYPAHPVIPKVIQLDIEGFILFISSLRLTPRGASGQVTVQLPGGMAALDSCQPACMDLGVIPLTPTCEIYIEAPDKAYGPWLLGDTGLQIEGTGYILDLSTTHSPTGRPPGWRALLLMNGQATGKNLVPDPCNTGYLRGLYGFTNAVIDQDGFDSLLSLQEACQFHGLNPRGYAYNMQNGWLQISQSRVSGGEFGPGNIELPREAVCKGSPGALIVVSFNMLSVQPDLDLAGEVDYGGGQLSWGELTHLGAEVVAWTAPVSQGFLYLPAGASPSFCPESGGVFVNPSISTVVDASLTELETYQMAGVTFGLLTDVVVFSPDRPGGSGNPIKLLQVSGWLRVGNLGVDGELHTYRQLNSEKLGEPARTGYVGIIPLVADLFTNDNKNLLAQFITSAVYDSNFTGRFRIPQPCAIPSLTFQHMQATSTAHLVGGNITLPVGGVPLDYWQLQLVPTGAPDQTGVVSVRTGRIIFIAAGISESLHFARPFNLTWGEMLANGNLGELYFDFNNYGQRFDGIVYNPHKLLLSKYIPGTPDPYLATCGSIHFNFFGAGYVNIRDARDSNASAPYFNRNVTVPKTGVSPGCKDTNLHLAGTWKDIISNDLAIFDCPDADVDYHTSTQDGFIGTGTADIAFFHSDGLDLQVEVHRDATDIRLSSLTSHDIDLGLYARLSGIGQVCGCARIEGPLMTRMSFYGILEHSVATGMSILEPKAGYAVEININVTPNSLDFYASGDMMMSVSAVEVELAASVHLLFDFERISAEGELIGRIDCDAVLAGLAGEGQITWYVGPDMQYLQGRMKIYVCSWVASGGMEGGFFIGHHVPNHLAWVLQPTNPHFGVSTAILPAFLTGLFGYGQLSFGVNWYVLGGGVDLYAGMGAFSEIPPGLSGAWSDIVGLPYVLGSCGVYVHGEILGGLVSASAWANLSLRGPAPTYFEGNFGLEGCVLWVMCASVDVTGGINSGGFYLY